MHLRRPRRQQRDDRKVRQKVRDRIHQPRDEPRAFLNRQQTRRDRVETLRLARLHIERAKDARSDEIFRRREGNVVELRALTRIQRKGEEEDRENRRRERRERDDENESPARIDDERHDRRAKNDDRGAKEETQQKVDGGLRLRGVASHARGEGIRAVAVELRERETPDLSEERASNRRGKSRRRLRRKVLRRARHREPRDAQSNENRERAPNNRRVPLRESAVDHPRHDERHEKVETRFEKFEKGRQYRLFFVR